ncbi:MAG: NAD-dependent epimerase/dehydratase family protein [Gammaproteobacteria bacterium]|nr:NAD-dependent epimerase/dehydratase family protein [Gammaproteobacteria bacterium]
MKQETICILGGTGFVGQHLANRLTRHGYKVRVLSRRRERHRALIVNPDITLFEADVHNKAELLRHFEGVDAIINLVGILNETGKKGAGFRRVHVELPAKIIAAAAASGVPRLLHMSALNADAGEQNSLYLKTKGEGEDLVHAAAEQGLIVTSFRPSVIFGAGDSFFNRFATLLKLSRPVFPLACPDSRFAPVCVTDVVEAMCRALDNATGGERMDLCGPDVYTLYELVEYTRDQLGLKCHIARLGNGLSRLQARILGLMPGKPFTMDNYYSLQHDSVCTDNALPTLGITPTPIAAVVPGYLAQRNARGHYQQFRRHSRRTQTS